MRYVAAVLSCVFTAGLATGQTCPAPEPSPSPSPSPSPAPERPNIVVVITDDAGIATFDGVPQFQQLGVDGTTLKVHYSAALCSPGRALLLNGRYPERDGIHRGEVYRPDSPDHMPESVVTLGGVLAGVGYDTAIIGKYHLGEDGPCLHGFAYCYWHPYAISDVLEDRIRWFLGSSIVLDYPKTDLNSFKKITRQVFEPALSWLASGRDPSKPFLLVVAPDMTHKPYQCEFKVVGEQPYQCASRELGNWLGTLRAALPPNTILIVTSDNGSPETGKHYNGALRGGKDSGHEGGIRVPLWIVGPGVPAGAVVDTPTAIWDWLPTLAGLAGTVPPTDRVIDGKDIWPVITGTGERGDGVFVGWWDEAYREGCLKYNKSAQAVFDLCVDPNETTPIPSLKVAWKAKWLAATPLPD